MNILVVENHEEMRMLLTDVLENSGHTVIAAAHGTEAVAALQMCPVDLVVCDVIMPKVDGLEFFMQVRRLHIPIIALSDLDRDRFVSDLLVTFGVCAFLQKPFSPDLLVETVSRLESYTVVGSHSAHA